MKVFKLKPSYDTHSLELNEENYTRATKFQKPYVQGSSLFAVCPECNNPIQIVGLYGKQKNTDTFAKHVNDKDLKLKEIAIYNEINKQQCKFYTGKKCVDPFEKVDKGDLDKVLCKTMRDEFDKVVHHWNVLTGIKLSNAKAKEYLTDWIKRKMYFRDFCTTSTLSLSLRCAVETDELFNKWIRVNSALYKYITSELKDVAYFHDTKSKLWKQVKRKNNIYSSLEFNFLPYYKRTTSNDGCIEKMTLQIVSINNKRKKEKEIPLKIESKYWDNLLNMKNFHQNEELLEFARGEFAGMDLSLNK